MITGDHKIDRLYFSTSKMPLRVYFVSFRFIANVSAVKAFIFLPILYHAIYVVLYVLMQIINNNNDNNKTNDDHHWRRQRDHLPVPAVVCGTPKGKCGLFSKHVHYQLARCNIFSNITCFCQWELGIKYHGIK